MKRRIPVIILILVLLFTAFAIAESIGCPRMDSEGCAMMNGSCNMMNAEGCSMMNGSCNMMNAEGCSMMNGSCNMIGSEGCSMMSSSRNMMGSEGCAMMNGSCNMMGSEGCAMMGGHAGYVTHVSELPCQIAIHSLSEDGATPPGYHFLTCEDCSLVTGIDYYLCMRSCTACGLHVHAQETHHDCPIIGLVLC